jgi:hypothetical protein
MQMILAVQCRDGWMRLGANWRVPVRAGQNVQSGLDRIREGTGLSSTGLKRRYCI